MIVAIDGPAASGKSTAAKGVSKALSITHLDTGAMYRAVTYGLLKNKIKFTDLDSISSYLSNLSLRHLKRSRTFVLLLNGMDISEHIRYNNINENVSEVSAIKIVRESMVKFQRMMADDIDCVLEGRDIGTVVFPNADFKFFLTASDEARANRRLDDLIRVGDKNPGEFKSVLDYAPIEAQFVYLATDSHGNKYVSKNSATWQSYTNRNEVHKIDNAGNGSLFHISTTTLRQVAIDSNDTLYITTASSKSIIKIETNNGVKGTVTENFGGDPADFTLHAGFGQLGAIAVDKNDNIFVYNDPSYSDRIIYKIDQSGNRETYLTMTQANENNSVANIVTDIAFDSNNIMYLAHLAVL